MDCSSGRRTGVEIHNFKQRTERLKLTLLVEKIAMKE